MISQILNIFLIAIGFLLFVGYFYLAGRLIPRHKNDKLKRNKLGWLAMMMASFSIFLFSLAWMIREAWPKEFILVFLIISVFIGFLARESAISPYRLGEFWFKLGEKYRKKKD